MNRIRIVSDGTPIGTKVFTEKGEVLSVEKIEILPITVNSLVKAKLTFPKIELDIEAIKENETDES